MKAIAVDDEPLMLYALSKAVKASSDIESVSEFSSCDDALDWMKNHRADIAFLDINMRGMGGLALAQKMMEFQPDCKIVFCTGYDEYAVAAIKLRVSGYLMKPISSEDVQEEIDYIKRMKEKNKEKENDKDDKDKRLTVRCFGNFEVCYQGKKLAFKRTKTKELLAFLVDRKGAGVTSREIIARLWTENKEEKKYHNYLRQLFVDLRRTLETVNLGNILIYSNHCYSLDAQKIDCDYYTYLKTGKPEFYGEYMVQYSWAEGTGALLWRKNY